MGIDYGRGLTNIDTDTGIRFGVISQNEVLQAWCDSSEPEYGEPHCPKCGNECCEYDDEKHGDYLNLNTGYRSNAEYGCESCELYLDSEDTFGEPIAHKYSSDNYECEQSYDSGDIFILKSPFYTKCGFCSPCAPGAGYLLSQDSEDCKAYCFGVDWFEDGQIPYDIYSVADDSLIYNFKGK